MYLITNQIRITIMKAGSVVRIVGVNSLLNQSLMTYSMYFLELRT